MSELSHKYWISKAAAIQFRGKAFIDDKFVASHPVRPSQALIANRGNARQGRFLRDERIDSRLPRRAVASRSASSSAPTQRVLMRVAHLFWFLFDRDEFIRLVALSHRSRSADHGRQGEVAVEQAPLGAEGDLDRAVGSDQRLDKLNSVRSTGRVEARVGVDDVNIDLLQAPSSRRSRQSSRPHAAASP